MAEQPSTSSRGCGPQQTPGAFKTSTVQGRTHWPERTERCGLVPTAYQKWFFKEHEVTCHTSHPCAHCNMRSHQLYQVEGHKGYCAQCWHKWWTHMGQASGQTATGGVAVPSRPRPDNNQRPTRTAPVRAASWPPTRPLRPGHSASIHAAIIKVSAPP